MFSEHALWLERIDNKHLVGWLVHVCVQLAEILPRHPHLWCYFCFSSACTQEYKQSPRTQAYCAYFLPLAPGYEAKAVSWAKNSIWMVSRPPNARANRQSREDHFALKGTRQTFAFNFIFYVSFADKVAVWLQIHTAEASLCCLRSQVSVLQNSIPVYNCDANTFITPTL